MKQRLFLPLMLLILGVADSVTNVKNMENQQNDNVTLFVTWTPNPEKPEAMQEYAQGVMPHLMALGAKVIKRSQLTDVYYGEEPFPFFAIIDFPSKKELVAFFDSETYQAYVPLRNKGFSKIQILFAEDLD